MVIQTKEDFKNRFNPYETNEWQKHKTRVLNNPECISDIWKTELKNEKVEEITPNLRASPKVAQFLIKSFYSEDKTLNGRLNHIKNKITTVINNPKSSNFEKELVVLENIPHSNEATKNAGTQSYFHRHTFETVNGYTYLEHENANYLTTKIFEHGPDCLIAIYSPKQKLPKTITIMKKIKNEIRAHQIQTTQHGDVNIISNMTTPIFTAPFGQSFKEAALRAILFHYQIQNKQTPKNIDELATKCATKILKNFNHCINTKIVTPNQLNQVNTESGILYTDTLKSYILNPILQTAQF